MTTPNNPTPPTPRNIVEKAIKELEIAQIVPESDGSEMGDANARVYKMIIAVVEAAATIEATKEQWAHVAQAMHPLLLGEPITELLGDDTEWEAEAVPIPNLDREGLCYQSTRCDTLYRREDGTAFDLAGLVFTVGTGQTFTTEASVADITFPYTANQPRRVPLDEELRPISETDPEPLPEDQRLQAVAAAKASQEAMMVDLQGAAAAAKAAASEEGSPS